MYWQSSLAFIPESGGMIYPSAGVKPMRFTNYKVVSYHHNPIGLFGFPVIWYAACSKKDRLV